MKRQSARGKAGQTSTPLRRKADARGRIIKAAAAKSAHITPLLKTGQTIPRGFVQAYFADTAAEDLTATTPAELAAIAVSHLCNGYRRRKGRPSIKAFNPTQAKNGWDGRHTVIQLVNDDMPFLVDSVTMAVNRLGYGIHLTLHPVLFAARADDGQITHLADSSRAPAESFIHIEVDREPDAKRRKALVDELESTLRDVRAAVNDWQPMLRELRHAASTLAERGGSGNPIQAESAALLSWMADDHFTLLGYREYRLGTGKQSTRLLPIVDTDLGLCRRRQATPLDLTKEMLAEAASADPLVITKANSKSTVHRPAYLDYIGVKVFDDGGRAVGERRFLGLFTSSAYSRNARDIPLLRAKVAQVMRSSKLDPRSHRGKALQHILDNFPRDELMQSSIPDLQRTARGILDLQERQRVRLFVRRDTFRRFYACLVFVPREKYNTRVRRRIEAQLLEGLSGVQAESEVSLTESVLARLHLVVRTDPNSEQQADIAAIETQLAEAVTTWQDKLKEALLDRLPEDRALALFREYEATLPEAYREDVTPLQGSHDLEKLNAVDRGGSDMELALYRRPDEGDVLHFKIVRREEPIPLSRVLPMLENMGLSVISERPYRSRLSPPIWIQDLELKAAPETQFSLESISQTFHDCFRAVLSGQSEDDGFNALVLLAGMDHQQISVIRGYCKYLLQTGLPFSQRYMESVICRHPRLTQALVCQFVNLFDPATKASDRRKNVACGDKEISQLLAQVASLDDDRILRGFVACVRATLRTNFYVTASKSNCLAFKLDPSRIRELPKPLPYREIFVYSPRIEGVHLRGGPIARGGLRWSDRKEDFRTEVLGLMKAQQVKNTVIVPTGAKGGFVCKRLPSGDREQVQAEVEACYRTFIRGLLDVTDNLVESKVRKPAQVVRRDEDDPYLVVAADKGTATFSDIANGVAEEYGFWLGDAFASGGSAGYDHKKMAITARGAWEAVKRHFRELAIDVQTQPITVAGIGDMSGDVFGNGLLQSECLRLVAAFNHQHIFLDPEPDPQKSFAERKRLFELPRSSWTDYREDLISAGGGVYSRNAKAIDLHPRAQALLGVSDTSLTPPALIQAILRMKVDLLWNGGIGTYAKSRDESNAEAGDRGNDAVRVNGEELGARVIGEGGNLGFTQKARIEFSQAGGLINTDFIDNSGGVDCSDREVNIKILLNAAIQAAELAPKSRDKLLERMTDDVSSLVLRSNYLQTQAISVSTQRSVERLSEHAMLIRRLEQSGLLDRELEFLPSDEDIDQRRKLDLGLTRPEIAVLVSYAKLDLFAKLVDSDIPEDPYLAGELAPYFPSALGKRFQELFGEHRLKREIIAMLVTGSMVNRMGPAFALRAAAEAGASPSSIARAYTAAREIFSARKLWSALEGLDNQVQTEVQYEALFHTSRLLRRTIFWLLQNSFADSVDEWVTQYKPAVTSLAKDFVKVLPTRLRKRYDLESAHYQQVGLPKGVAEALARLSYATAMLNISSLSNRTGLPVTDVARLYFELGRGLRLDWVRQQIEQLEVDGRWQALARTTLRNSLDEQQVELLTRILPRGGKVVSPTAISDWLEKNAEAVKRLRVAFKDMQNAPETDFPTLTVAVNQVKALAQR